MSDGRRLAPPPASAPPEFLWDYAPATETFDLDLAARHELFINGRFTPPKSRKYATIVNPATGMDLTRAALAGPADVDAAVRAARAALPKWRKLPARERAKLLFRIVQGIEHRARDLALLETANVGKPITESRDGDVPEAARHFFYYAGWADKLDFVFPGQGCQPVGVCGAIIPWNYPLLLAAWKLAPALAAGNTVVLKPADSTPLSALVLAEILQEAELPPGVVNVISGDGATGAALAAHRGVDLISFTGSTETGRQIAAAAAGTGRRLILELGGKSAQILFADASLDQAVEEIARGIFHNQGQACSAGSRLLVEEPILDEVIERLNARMKLLRVGDPLDRNTDVGAIHSQGQWNRIQRYLQMGQAEGARLHRFDCELPSAGWWHAPAFFSGVQPAHQIAREEIFGPVLAVMSFRTPEEAIARANNSPYGLAAGVWTDKGSKIFEIAARLKTGVVWCNSYHQFDPSSPFGGCKESGSGREGGVHGLRAYLEPA